MGFDAYRPEVALVTGGRGFAARHLVVQLLEKTEYVVRIMDLSSELKLSEDEEAGVVGRAIKDGRAHYVQADLRYKSKVAEAVKGVNTVFHMAAPDSGINKFQLHHDVTVTGTQNIVDACVELGVKKLIYTSSPSVVFDGVHSILDADESMPIPKKHNDFYSEAKAQAEAIVLRSNGKNGLLTCAIRPSGIFGPGDRLTVPTVVTNARNGKLKFIIGDGENLFDWTYVENVANAHLCADNSLIAGEIEGNDVAAGKAYFITNGEPVRFWEFFILILEGLGYPGPKRCIPVKLLMPFAFIVDWIFKLLAPLGVPASQFTPSRLRIISSTRTFNINRARKLIGYSPAVSLQEGIRRTVESYPHLRADVPTSAHRSGPSKMRLLLGDGMVGDVLLWSDTKQTTTVLSLLSFFGYLIFSSGYTLISLAANFACLGLLGFFAYSHLPESVFGTVAIPPVSSFQISEDSAERTGLVFRLFWNSITEKIGLLQQRGNLSLFFKVILLLEFTKFIGGFSLQTQTVLGLVIAFSLPYLYNEHQDRVDNFLVHSADSIDQYKKLALSKVPANIRKYITL